jgi:hypothetical protein
MREGFADFIAEGGAFALLGLLLVAGVGLRLTACTPTSTLPVPDVTITSTDAGPDACAVAAAACAARLIRQPNGQAACDVPPGCPK